MYIVIMTYILSAINWKFWIIVVSIILLITYVFQTQTVDIGTKEAFTPYIRSTYRSTMRGLRYKLREHMDTAGRYMRHVQRRYGLSLGF
jgi:hypothetical protein